MNLADYTRCPFCGYKLTHTPRGSYCEGCQANGTLQPKAVMSEAKPMTEERRKWLLLVGEHFENESLADDDMLGTAASACREVVSLSKIAAERDRLLRSEHQKTLKIGRLQEALKTSRELSDVLRGRGDRLRESNGELVESLERLRGRLQPRCFCQTNVYENDHEAGCCQIRGAIARATRGSANAL